MNVALRGKPKEIVETMVEEGYANTKSEAIRMALIKFGEEHLSEEELVSKKLDRIDKKSQVISIHHKKRGCRQAND